MCDNRCVAIDEVLKCAGLAPVRKGQPLPLHPAGSVMVADGVDLVENELGGVVALWGMASWCWDAGDVVGRRLAVVQIVGTKAATRAEAAAGSGVSTETVRRWSRDYKAGGALALGVDVMGPKRASKLTEEKKQEIRAARSGGRPMAEVAAICGVSLNSVSRALRGDDPLRPGGAGTAKATGKELVPLARPGPRAAERQAARAGLLAGAAPVFCDGASLPLAGALLILPALVAGGLVGAVAKVYGATKRACFYGLTSLVLTVVLSSLVGEPRAEGLSRVDPVALGRLLGMDRAPEVGTWRRRMEDLAGLGRSEDLVEAMAAAHLAANEDLPGIFYVDGHVRAYHGRAHLPKAHLARARLAMPGTVDTWVTDPRGDGVMVWTGPPGATLSAELGRAMAEVRALVGPDARPTLGFDRGGWSPKVFAEVIAAGFHILTYRKGKTKPEPRSAFVAYEHVDDLGHPHTYHLADRTVRLSYKQGKLNRRLAMRQVTRLDPASGHQTQALTTHDDWATTEVAQRTFNRWRIENFFRYMRPHFALDALDSYEKVPDDLERTVPNPAKAKAKAATKAARARQADAEKALADAVAAASDPASGSPAEATAAIKQATAALEVARAATEKAEQRAGAVPARVPLGDVRPDAVVPHPERKRIADVVRMATYNAQSALARALAPHYPRADDEANSLLREAFRASGDIEVVGDCLHVRLDGLSAPRRSRAIAALCDELNETETCYPGTELRLVYSVKNP